MPSVYGAIDLQKNELRNAVIQNLASAPSSPVKGQMYFNSTGGDNTLYWWDGTSWLPAKASTSLPLSSSASTLVVGGAGSGGAASDASRGDHVHALPNWGSSTAVTTFGAAKADGVALLFSRADHTHGSPTHDAAAHSTIPLNTYAVPTGSLNLNSQLITNLLAPVAGTDAANKTYVDNAAQGLDAKASVKAASTANIANLATGAPNTLDGIALALNDRVLVKDQTTQGTNGIYTVTTLGTGANGVWTRATDMDAWAEVPAAYVWVEQGTTQADTGWVSTADQGGTLNTTAITWTQFSGAGQITAGAGLTKTGNTIDAVAGDTSLTVAADSIVVNTAVIATRAYVDASSPVGVTKKYAAALTGTGSPETVTHNLNTRDVDVTVLNGASPYTAIEVDWDATTVNSVTLRYSPNLGAGYRVVVIG